MEYIFIILIILIIILIIYLYYSLQNSNIKLVSCFQKRFGCCSDNYTPKLDIFGSNCRGF
jgi:hypothetical protein